MAFYKYKDYLLAVKILDDKGNKIIEDDNYDIGNDLEFDISKVVKEVKL
jgi:hypothetical protein